MSRKGFLSRWMWILPAVVLMLWACAEPQIPKYTMPQSPYTPEDFYYEGDYLACYEAEVSLGVDVSHHQGQIDWQQVADSGVEFAIVRLGYRGLSGGALHTDDFVHENLEGARCAGLKVGAYFYSQAVSVEEARQEAAFALEILGDTRLDMPLVFDWEQESRTEQVSVETATACAIAFCEAVKAAGFEPMVYFNSYQARNLMDMEQLECYPWWLAMYEVGAEFPCRMDIWQYSCTGSIPGIEGQVDLNLWFPEEVA